MNRIIVRVLIACLTSACAVRVAQADEVTRIDLKSSPLATPVSLGEGLADVAALRIEAELSAGRGKGRISFDSSVYAFERFGDAVREGDESIVQRSVSLTVLKKSFGRTAVELFFDDKASPRRWMLVLSDGTAGPHKLLVGLPKEAPDPERLVWEFQFEMHGLPEANPPIPVLPRRYPVALASPDLYVADGRFHRFEIHLTDETHGTIDAWSSEIGYDVLGESQGAAAGRRESREEFELQAIEENDSGGGRSAFRLNLKERPVLPAGEYVLVLAAEGSDSHRLLKSQDEKVVHVIPLHDPKFYGHLRRFAVSRSRGVPESEREAIEEVRRRIGDRFQYAVWDKTVSSLEFEFHGPIGPVDDLLSKFSTVEQITLRKDHDIAELPSLVKLGRLRNLHLSDTRIDERGLANICRLVRLRELGFFQCPGLNDEAVRQLAELPDLEVLRISRSLPAGEKLPDGPTITDAGVASLAGKTKLKDLAIYGYDLSDASLEMIAGLKALERLDLSGDRITDAGISRLTSLSQLRWLRLSRTSVSDAAQERLKQQLPNLRFGHR